MQSRQYVDTDDVHGDSWCTLTMDICPMVLASSKTLLFGSLQWAYLNSTNTGQSVWMSSMSMILQLEKAEAASSRT